MYKTVFFLIVSLLFIKLLIQVVYLRDFKSLRSLNTCDNPCTEMDGYLDYLFAFVPQLIYYQYRIISENTRQSAIDKH